MRSYSRIIADESLRALVRPIVCGSFMLLRDGMQSFACVLLAVIQVRAAACYAFRTSFESFPSQLESLGEIFREWNKLVQSCVGNA